MKSAQIRRHLIALLAAIMVLLVGKAGAAGPVVHAVLFYSPTCPHCHVVLDKVLPPLQTRYGEQLAVALVDVTRPDGQALYDAAIVALNIPQERLGVPTLIVGQTVLVGSEEIPRLLPRLIEDTLAKGGNTWPAIPGLEAALADMSLSVSQPVVSPFQRDPLGNSLALIVLVGMVITVAASLASVRPPFDRPLKGRHAQAVPLLALAGLAVSAYLAFVEIGGARAVCGPVGDCNAVQQSPYARLFGVLPVAVVGLLGYAAILAAWAVQRFGHGAVARRASLALPVMAFGGTLFAIYLTFLEPFVIGAACLWCLTSAVLITALLWLTVPRGSSEVQRGKGAHRVAGGAS